MQPLTTREIRTVRHWHDHQDSDCTECRKGLSLAIAARRIVDSSKKES